MASLEIRHEARLRRVLFAACAACTLWLIVQNTILLALLPQAWVPAALQGAAATVRAAVAWVVPLALIPLAFTLGWLASRRLRDAGRRGEGFHE